MDRAILPGLRRHQRCGLGGRLPAADPCSVLLHSDAGSHGLYGPRSLYHGWANGARRSFRAGLHRSEEQKSEIQSLMRISYAVFCLTKQHPSKFHMIIVQLAHNIEWSHRSTHSTTEADDIRHFNML